MTELEAERNNDNQVKSRKRVADHGEVFTAQREVNAMLDLVKQETERIESRFLEPACCTGNFLVEILKRKLAVVENRYAKSQLEYERYAIIAILSIYSVDILQDNLQTCRDRLLGIFRHYYLNNFKKDIKPGFLKADEFVVSKNILWGDALTLKIPDEKAEPIVFAEWSAVNGGMMKRRDYDEIDFIKTLIRSMNSTSDQENESQSNRSIELFLSDMRQVIESAWAVGSS